MKTRMMMIVALMGLLAGPAFARPGKGMLDPEHVDRVAAELKLDAATTQKMKDRLYAAKKEGAQVKADLESARIDLRRLMEQDAPNRDAVMKQVELAGQKEIALQKLRFGTMLDLHAMLTPAQRTQMRAMHQRHMDEDGDSDRKRGKRGKHGKGGPPDEHPRD